MAPEPAEKARLRSLRVGDGDEDGRPRLEQRAELFQCAARIGEVLEAVPESGAAEGAARLGDRSEDLQLLAPRRSRIPLGARDLPAASAGRVEEAAVAAADVEDAPFAAESIQ